MSGNARIEPEAIEMGHPTVSSTIDHTAESTVVETSLKLASYGVFLNNG